MRIAILFAAVLLAGFVINWSQAAPESASLQVDQFQVVSNTERIVSLESRVTALESDVQAVQAAQTKAAATPSPATSTPVASWNEYPPPVTYGSTGRPMVYSSGWPQYQPVYTSNGGSTGYTTAAPVYQRFQPVRNLVRARRAAPVSTGYGGQCYVDAYGNVICN